MSSDPKKYFGFTAFENVVLCIVQTFVGIQDEHRVSLAYFNALIHRKSPCLYPFVTKDQNREGPLILASSALFNRAAVGVRGSCSAFGLFLFLLLFLTAKL